MPSWLYPLSYPFFPHSLPLEYTFLRKQKAEEETLDFHCASWNVLFSARQLECSGEEKAIQSVAVVLASNRGLY